MIETCKECGREGRVGTEVAPYNFGRDKAGEPITRWLCAPCTGRQCRDIRYEKYRAHRRKLGDSLAPPAETKSDAGPLDGVV